jgi:recombination protein RecA
MSARDTERRKEREEGGIPEQKRRNLELTLQSIEKQFGKGSVMRLGERAVERIPVIPTGSFSLDLALGVGGFPRGRLIEIYGPESSGKTTLALQAVASVQNRLKGVSAFVDAEHALDPSYARKLGVVVDELIVSQPASGEEALEITEQLVRSGAVDLVVIDSVAALTPRAELEGEMGDAHVGLQARLMSQALRKLTAAVSRTMSTIIFINQIRMRIGPGAMYGNPETTTGGTALKFYASVRVDLRKAGTIKQGTSEEDVIGMRVRARVVKNKVAPPFRSCEFDILYESGISYEGDLLDLGEQMEIIEKAGSWYSYGSQRLGQGRFQAIQFLKDHPEIASEIEAKIRAHAGLPPVEELVRLPTQGGVGA